jgi:methylenetetrahydrofolate dehydrogenase (NADP+) / methenyltetrahydrofolate cyclohydrolase
MAIILDGKKLAQKIKSDLKAQVTTLKKEVGCVPRMVNVMVGRDPGTCAYANAQKKVAEELGIQYALQELPERITQQAFAKRIRELNDNPAVHGIMVHKPVPSQIDYHLAAHDIDIAKDLEGINVANIGKMLLGETNILPCTPAAVMEHLYSTGIPLRGKEAVVVGHSDIVGKPLSLLLLRAMATVTVCHVATSEAGKLVAHVNNADVLIVAVGKPALIKGAWIKPGAIVIDVGINRSGDKVVGDVEFTTAEQRAGYITPVPGGVGPLTVVMLMRNAIEAFKMQQKGGAE